MDVIAGVVGAVAALAVNGIATKAIAKLPAKAQGMATKLLPVAKTGLAVYGSKSIKNKHVKNAAVGFGITSGLEVTMQIPGVGEYVKLSGTGDLFNMIGNVGETVYLPIAPNGEVDSNQDFFTQEAVLGTENLYSDIPTL